MKNILSFTLIILVLGTLILGACAAPTPTQQPTTPTTTVAPTLTTTSPTPKPSPTATATAKPVELKIWCAWPVKKTFAYPWNEWYRDAINKNGASVGLSAAIIGGPETFPTYDGIQSQLSGVFDIAVTAPPYYLGVVPQALSVMMNQNSPWESRQKGVFDILDKYHQKGGLKYLGWTGYGAFFQAYSTFDTPKPDLTGKIMRTAPIYDPLVKALGGTPVNVAPAEIYDALKKGMVHGFFWPNLGITDLAWHEVVKYYWGQPTPYVVDSGITMNLNKWNSLTKEQQAVLDKAAQDIERQIADYWKQQAEKQYADLVGKGILKEIKFSDADYKYFKDTAVDVVWKQILAKNPETEELKKLMTK